MSPGGTATIQASDVMVTERGSGPATRVAAYRGPRRRARRRTDGPTAREWQESGSCRDADPGLFFGPERERGMVRTRRIAAAKRICAHCPVLLTCRAYAFDNAEEFGVWGGLSERERESLARRRRR